MTSRDLSTEIPGSSHGEGYRPRDNDELEEEEEDDYDFFSTGSMASTADDMVEEMGRRYANKGYGETPLPRGDQLAQQNERDLHNLMLYLYQDKLFVSKLDEPRNVLDVRCGQLGLWAKNMAESFPNAEITAMDVSRLDNEGLPNLEFVLQSFNQEWTLDDRTNLYGNFDFIHARHIFAASSDYPEFYRQCFEHLEPGGYLEQCEFFPAPQCDDGCYKKDAAILRAVRLVPDLNAAYNTDYTLAATMKSLIEAAGFVDVKEQVVKMPWSPWASPGTEYHRIGELLQRFIKSGIQGWMMAPLVKYKGFTEEQVNEMCSAITQEIDANDQHWYYQSFTLTARKPGAPPDSFPG